MSSNKIKIPASTIWHVGLSALSFILIMGAFIVTFFHGPIDLDNTSLFTKIIIIGTVLGAIFAVVSIVFNVVIFLIITFGSAVLIGVGSLWEIITKTRQNKKDSS